MDFIKKNGAGLLLCLCIAIPAWLLGQAVPVVGGPVFSILIGMVLTLFWKNKTKVQPGIGFTSKKVLQYAVILLGFGLNLSEIAKVGAQSLPIIVSTIGTSLIVSFVLCKAMKVPSNISTLVGVGSSICGGSAIAATAPVIGADDEEIAQAISVIFLFNVIAALTFPMLGGMLGQLLPFDMTGVDFAMTALFIVILINQLEHCESKLPAAVSFVSALACLLIFGPDNFLLPSLAATVVALIAFQGRLEGKVRVE